MKHQAREGAWWHSHGQTLVVALADAICAQAPSGALDTALAVVAEVAKRKRLEAVKEFSLGREPKHISRADQAIAAVCRRFGVTPEELKSACRKSRYTIPRVVAWQLMRTEMLFSVTEIGEMFDRDHSTILRQTEAYGDSHEVAAHVTEIAELLRSQWLDTQPEAAE